MASAPIPIAILTGFLGAGKTTLLNVLLKDPFLSDAALIINEFGDVGIDHLLVERADENVIEMASGCLCCTIRGDLIDTMHDLLARRGRGEVRAFNRIVIETTGLADPAPVLHSVMSEPSLLAACRLEGVITVVDAYNGMATLNAHPEAVKQVAVADRIVLTKLDLLVGREGEDMLFAIIGRLRRLAPAARLLTTHRNEATAERLFTMGLFNPSTKSADVQSWLAAEAYETGEKRGRRGRRAHSHGQDHDHHNDHDHHHHDTSRHGDHIRSFSFSDSNAISPQGLELFMELLKSYHGANMLRMKGIVKVSDDPSRPVVLHGVQHVFHPPVRLPAWPDKDERTRLVFIVKDIEKPMIEGLFRAFTDQITGGAEAFTDKTLSLKR
ncbi:MAG: GTP-binding protein [Aestuariivirga sp.]|uniref:CobW family GTP-binding protein n=1 Tax=Aestuariivirga sp. TaxID=2650926 RepID=UPI0025C360D8|nr:GTP-binding protein [Aestuariivirga sp.]MCA3561360.1 GTP-binding protein [Aestuariivirga sp.]